MLAVIACHLALYAPSSGGVGAFVAIVARIAGREARDTLMIACVALVATAVTVRAILAESEPLAAYVLLPARMDTLGIGAWLALWVRGTFGTETARGAAGPILAVTTVMLVALAWLSGGGAAVTILATATVGASFAVAAASSRGLELPTLYLKRYFNYGLRSYRAAARTSASPRADFPTWSAQSRALRTQPQAPTLVAGPRP